MPLHRRLTMAVVGLGFGRSHVADALGRPHDIELVGVVDQIDPATDPRIKADSTGRALRALPYFRSLDELLAEKTPDIVAIATPIHTHATLAAEALTAGSHVLLEKPPTASLDEHGTLMAQARAADRAVQVGFQARGGGGIRAVQDLIASGRLGEIKGIGVVGLWVRDRAYYGRARWAGKRTLDGVTVMDGALTNPFAHAVDAALVLDGALRAADVLDVEIDAWHAHDIEADDTTSAVITTARGTRISIGLTLCAPREIEAPIVTVYGTHGTARLEYTADRLTTRVGDKIETTTFPRTLLLHNLVAHIRDGVTLLAPLEDTQAFTAVLDAARTGRAPRPVASEHVRWVGAGAAAHPMVTDVEEWCDRVASTGRTFTELGAPWTVATPALEADAVGASEHLTAPGR